MHTVAQTMENPADLINAAIETLLVEHCELPAFSTLGLMAGRIRRLINRGIYQSVFARMPEAKQQALSRLLEPDELSPFTAFDQIKDAPKQDVAYRVLFTTDTTAHLVFRLASQNTVEINELIS